MAKQRISAKLLTAQKGPFVIWDSEVKGLYARRQSAAGRTTYGFRYTNEQGVKREVKLGDASQLTPEQVRDLAKIEAGKVATKVDPAAERDKGRSAKTLAEVWADYDAAVVSKKRGRTPDMYRAMWSKHLLPHLGRIRIDRLTLEDVERMHAAVTALGGARNEKGHKQGGPVTANRTVTLLSGICERAIARRWITANPCKGVTHNPETPKDLRYSNEELALIQKALSEEGEAEQIAFSLFLETPVRHGNVAAAEWSEFVDLEGDGPVWRIPGDKLKGGEPYEAHLSKELATKLAKYRDATFAASPRYLFPRVEQKLAGKKAKGAGARKSAPERSRKIIAERPRLSFQSAWERISARAIELAGERGSALKGLRSGTVHTFKHTYLTRIADLGASAVELQAIGDHADIRTSMGYVHRARGRIRELARQASDALPKPAL